MSKEKTSRVLTESDLSSMLEKIMNKISVVKEEKPPRPSIDDLKAHQNAAILSRQLAIERNEKVQKAIEREAPLEEKIAALGSDITPYQMVKLHQNNAAASQPALPSPPNNHSKDMMRIVLGHNPSTRELERYADISQKLVGKNLSRNERGEIMINSYPIPGSNLESTIRFFVKGTRGFKSTPIGVIEIGGILKEAGIASSKFPESIRPFLGGKKGRRRRAQPPPSIDESSDGLEFLTNSFKDLALDSESEQHGEGLKLLNDAMDHAESGYHDEAFDLLNAARQLKAPRIKLKEVENYLSSLRD